MKLFKTLINKINNSIKKRRLDSDEVLEFDRINNVLCLNRIKVISIALIVLSIYFFYADCFLFNTFKCEIYKRTLFLIHFIIFDLSIIFLFFYRWIIKKNDYDGIKIQKLIIKFYVFFSVLLGTITSINSQRLTDNIYNYIIIIFFTAILFPIEPKYKLFVYLINHIFFILKISNASYDYYKMLADQINSTTVVVVAIFISFSMYKYKIDEFLRKNRLKESELNFKKLFEVNPFPLFITTIKDGKIIMANKKAMKFYGISEEKLKMLDSEDFYKNTDERKLMIEQLKNEKSIENYIVEHKKLSGEIKWVISNYKILDYKGEKCILGGVTDITELKRMEDKLAGYAFIDPLTGISNRRKGLESLKELINKTQKGNYEFAICFIDINGLKKVNDLYGHKEGDFFIITVCNTIKSSIGKEDILFRYGGDEFIILFPDKTKEEVDIQLKQINNSIDKLNRIKNKPYKISISIGLYYYESNMNLTIDEIIKFADDKMYEQKIKYRNNRKIY
ncbi:sensor domain-containing diguanylate cyclase [Maledivibacter halophilus]|uniref:PAS domain S-box-containing protein/diguanylate cyclase (GGDEF) domain-containing protein n=1 Tax=Maledivibacter halophilus TaxID=36842 RepID=A0A1T5MUN3_9FIRM|nr:sensor domain-containing diguanylate cyclase [Maledivibacter halophilus]SKC91940.1 PAS domain S-box-containing protein/diguanylate cyclase (GGDEF) domain-containing protein [Maledivibacter halophilus]